MWSCGTCIRYFCFIICDWEFVFYIVAICIVLCYCIMLHSYLKLALWFYQYTMICILILHQLFYYWVQGLFNDWSETSVNKCPTLNPRMNYAFRLSGVLLHLLVHLFRHKHSRFLVSELYPLSWLFRFWYVGFTFLRILFPHKHFWLSIKFIGTQFISSFLRLIFFNNYFLTKF